MPYGARQARPLGTCPECNGRYATRTDGSLRKHGTSNYGLETCAGSGGQPLAHSVAKS